MNTAQKVELLAQIGKKLPNNTISVIARHLQAALVEFCRDGDKIPSYDKKSMEAKAIIVSILGCRNHGEINCTVCKPIMKQGS